MLILDTGLVRLALLREKVEEGWKGIETGKELRRNNVFFGAYLGLYRPMGEGKGEPPTKCFKK